MKKLVSQFASFFSYHNAVPIAVSVLFVGGASAFAATATGVLPLPNIPAAVAPSAPEKVDVSALLSANPDTFAFNPTVTNVVETDTKYTVSYSLQTLAPQGSAWSLVEKTGEFSVAKEALDETGLQGYVVNKLKDIENGERAYLSRAQEAEKKLADARAAKPANAFASLVGLALDQITVPKVEKPVPEVKVEAQPETPPAQNTEPQATEVSVHTSSASSESSSPGEVNAATSTTATSSAATVSASSTPQTVDTATTTSETIADTSESASATSTPAVPADVATSTENTASSTPSTPSVDADTADAVASDQSAEDQQVEIPPAPDDVPDDTGTASTTPES
jgi:hypothetical protein